MLKGVSIICTFDICNKTYWRGQYFAKMAKVRGLKVLLWKLKGQNYKFIKVKGPKI
jgi:hypothetical protein